jgi:DNA polymerase-3 subunit delta'
VRNLKREATRGPALGPARLFVVAEAQELVSQEASPEAANALLKLLEEPPERCSLVLTASEPGRLLPTIRSRTSDLYVPPLPSHQVREFLSRHLDASAEEIGKATSLCGGSIGRALGYLPSEGERGPLERARQEAFHLLRAALSPDSADGFERSLSYPPAGARGLHELLSALECWLRDLSAVASWERAPVLNEDARSWLIEAARREQIDPRRAAECIQFVENARGLASGNVNPQLILSRMLAEIRNGLRDSSPVPGEVS